MNVLCIYVLCTVCMYIQYVYVRIMFVCTVCMYVCMCVCILLMSGGPSGYWFDEG